MDFNIPLKIKSVHVLNARLRLGILTQPNTTTESCWELRRDGAWKHGRVVAAQVVLGEDSPQKLCLVTVFRGVHRQKLAIT